MTAMAGAAGTRTWLQTRGWSWMTPQRLRRATIALLVAATLVPTVGLSGSSKPPSPASSTASTASAR